MRAHELHGVASGGAQGAHSDPVREGSDDPFRRFSLTDHARAQAESPGGGRDDERLRVSGVAAPMGGGEFIFDEPVGGKIVGHPEKGFGEHHQRETFLR